MFSVYVVTNTVTGKRYVGITKMSVKRRWQKHQSEASKGSGWVLHRSIRKHGLAAFDIRTVAEGLDRVEAGEMECVLIADLNTKRPNGYNMTDGGDGSRGYKHTEEWKAELSRRNTGRKMPREAVERQRQAMLGYVHTDEARANMAAAQTGRKHSEATLQKMQESALRRWETNPRVNSPEEQERLRNLAVGATRTDEHKAAVSAAMKGKPKSLEHRLKLSAARKAAWKKARDDRSA